MIRPATCLFADRHHGPENRKTHDGFVWNHAAIDDGQAGSNTVALDPIAVVAAEVGATRIV